MSIDLKSLAQVVGRCLLSLITLFLITKMLGKKQVSQLSLFDYVIGISIGNFAAEMTINLESHYLHGTIAVIVFGIIAYAIEVLTMKSIKLRRYFMGTPTVLIENGVLLEGGLKKVKFDINDLLGECRELGYFDISQIAYAIMEVNGEISILPKEEYRPTTLKDLNLKPQKVGLCSNVIIDGEIMVKNLENSHKTEEWLLKELKIKGKEKEDILLATLDIEDNLQIYLKNKKTMKDIFE